MKTTKKNTKAECIQVAMFSCTNLGGLEDMINSWLKFIPPHRVISISYQSSDQEFHAMIMYKTIAKV